MFLHEENQWNENLRPLPGWRSTVGSGYRAGDSTFSCGKTIRDGSNSTRKRPGRSSASAQSWEAKHHREEVV